MNLSRRVLPIFHLLSRNYCKDKPETQEVVRKSFEKLKRNQKKFGVDDGVPVYLKKGLSDRLMYQGSWLLVFLGLGLSVKLFVDIIFRDLGWNQPPPQGGQDEEC